MSWINLLETEPLQCLAFCFTASQPRAWRSIWLPPSVQLQGCISHHMPSNLQVLGLEQFSAVAHDKGSSHGSSRIIRLQYHEHPDYVPLLHRAYELWHDLEVDSGKVMERPSGFSCHLLLSMCTVHNWQHH